MAKSLNVLGIETSCDETALALVRVSSSDSPIVIADEVLSQTVIHEEYGGVVPELAAREHLKNLPVLYDQLMKNSSGVVPDLIAVTAGPGLKGCLLMGLSFAQALASAKKLPICGCHHIEGHLLSPFLNNPGLHFPYLTLVVSGGHTEIIVVKDVGKYELFARTIDDAAGEAFDKSANLLGITYPGGPRLADLADSVTSSPFKLPSVMGGERDFSFSGLKTAILLLVREHQGQLNDPAVKAGLCHAIQRSIVSNLIRKMKLAIAETGIQDIALVGGVSANRELRKEFSAIPGTVAWYANFKHCVDNAAMIAYSGGMRHLFGLPDYGTRAVFSRQPLAN